MNEEFKKITDKYQKMIDNVRWHLDTNKPTDKIEIQKCETQIADYEEMIRDLQSVISMCTTPAPVSKTTGQIQGEPNYIEKILHGMFPAYPVQKTWKDVIYSLRSAMIFANDLPHGAALTCQLVDIACLLWEYENDRLKNNSLPGTGNITKMKIKFQEGVQVSDKNLEGCVATIDELCIVETGEDKADAFRQVIKSISVLLAHNSGINSKELNSILSTNKLKQGPINFPVQFGKSRMADFEEDTWTFDMPEDFKIIAGEFALLPKTNYEMMLSKKKENEGVWTWVAMFYGAVKGLVDLKNYKEIKGKDAYYLEEQPKQWYAATQALQLWKKSDYGALPLPKAENNLGELLDHLKTVNYPAYGHEVVMLWIYMGKWHIGLRNHKESPELKTTFDGESLYGIVSEFYNFCLNRGYVDTFPSTLGTVPQKSETGYRANFLWGFEDNTIESIGYEFANGKTEAYIKECWDELVKRIKESAAAPTGTIRNISQSGAQC